MFVWKVMVKTACSCFTRYKTNQTVLSQETPTMLQSLQRTVNVTLTGGATIRNVGPKSHHILTNLWCGTDYLLNWSCWIRICGVSMSCHLPFTCFHQGSICSPTHPQEQKKGTTCCTCSCSMSSLQLLSRCMILGCNRWCAGTVTNHSRNRTLGSCECWIVASTWSMPPWTSLSQACRNSCNKNWNDHGRSG